MSQNYKVNTYSFYAIDPVDAIGCIKGIGIYFVILGHIYKCNNIGMWIYSFHMPLFFILSGYLIADKLTVPCYSEYFKKKFKSLIIPFILFRIALILYWWVVESGFRKLDLGPIWFLPILFSIEITIVPILLRHRSLLMTSVYLLINANVIFSAKIISVFVLSILDSALFKRIGLAFVGRGNQKH